MLIIIDVKYYLSNNSDLQAEKYTYEQALDHFILNGEKEGRFGYDNRPKLLKDIYSGLKGFGQGSSLSFSSYIDVNGTLYFTANDGIHGTELWKSDGTQAGTMMVKDINKYIDSSSVSNLTNVDGTLYFTANDGAQGQELWMSDGTEADTKLVKDIYKGSGYSQELGVSMVYSADPSNLTEVDAWL